MAKVESMADFMEAIARKMKADVPAEYGYKADISMGVGFYQEAKTGVKVLEKPVVIPSGQPLNQGYVVLFAYSSEEGVLSLLQGQMPPMLPATKKEPKEFESKAAIADNFGAKDGEASAKKGTSNFCVVFRVPAELATKVDTPGRDLWIIRFDQDVISPFLQAAKEGDAAMVQKGLDSGISGAVVDEDGVSALMMAAMIGSVETCTALLDKGADPSSAEPHNGKTPLMFAAQGGHTSTVEFLLGKKADASKADTEGGTALMWAATANKPETVKMLMSYGYLDVKNHEGVTALAIAEKLGHKETVAVLKA
mmetsp:Transcript_69570/g.225132  ORF Transcript_69570/g.225132 Transcript_69570/m.225132 type:complete len:309 (-) Transcript_69570:121-1047(-)